MLKTDGCLWKERQRNVPLFVLSFVSTFCRIYTSKSSPATGRAAFAWTGRIRTGAVSENVPAARHPRNPDSAAAELGSRTLRRPAFLISIKSLVISRRGDYNLQHMKYLEETMKKAVLSLTIIAALVLSLSGCGNARPSENEAPAAEPQITADIRNSAEAEPQATPSEAEAPSVEPGRQDGERFEAVIVLEGMEETVQYEHIVNAGAGFEMDYDYESFARQSEADRERFLSTWDKPESPENYLEVTCSTEDADTVAASVSEELSKEYEILRDSRELDRAGSCIYIEASVIKGTNRMADQLQSVYIIPASDGCRIATAHYSVESAEGFGRRFAYMLNTLSVMAR